MMRGELLYDVCRQCLDVFPTRELYHPHHVEYVKKAGSYSLGQTISFDSEGDGHGYTGAGFAPPTNLTWTMAPHAWLHLDVGIDISNSRIKLEFDAVTRVAVDGSDRTDFDIVVNGFKVVTFEIMDQTLHHFECIIDMSKIEIEGNLLNIQFIPSNRGQHFLPTSHANLPRVGLQKMTILPV